MKELLLKLSTATQETHDPLWRITVYWLVIVMFFALPVLVFALHALAFISAKFPGEFGYLTEFHRILAALLFAMLGFNSYDKRLINGHGIAKIASKK
jgi:hypothetical protein